MAKMFLLRKDKTVMLCERKPRRHPLGFWFGEQVRATWTLREFNRRFTARLTRYECRDVDIPSNLFGE